MNGCERFQDDLRAYLDGELSVVRRLAVRLHLARCASCREEADIMEQLSNDLRVGDAGTLEPSLRAKILAGLHEAAPDPPAEMLEPADPAPVPKWRRKPMIIWGATATVLLAWFFLHPILTGQEQRVAPSLQTSPASPQASVNAETETTKGRVGSVYGRKTSADTGFAPGASAPVADEMKNNIAPSKEMMARMKVGRSDQAEPSPAQVANEGIGTLIPTERQVRKQADITVEVDKLEEKSDTVEQMVKTAGGFVANNQLSTGEDGLKTASLTTRIPVGEFENFLAKVAKLGEVKAKNVQGEDITEQVSDQNQAVRVLSDDIRLTEAKLREKRGGALHASDEETLRQMRVRVAQAQARLDMLKKLAALSTVTVQLREKSKTPAVQQGGFLDEMRDTGHMAVQSFLQAARLPILMLIWLLAYAPIWIVLAIAYKYAVRT
jgi:hypothetical protein